MAIIQEADSDDDVLQDDDDTTSDHDTRDPANSLSSAARDPALEQLLRSKKTVKATDFDTLLGAGNSEDLVHNLCHCTERLLTGTSLDQVDINRLERTADIIRFLESAINANSNIDTWLSFLRTLCDALVIPCEFMSEEYAITPEISQIQSFWSAGATAIFQILANLLSFTRICEAIQTSQENASILTIAASRFLAGHEGHAEAAWINQLSSSLAQSILARLAFADSERLASGKDILLNYLKPLFSSTPHPALHPETARTLPRTRGGDLFSDTWAESLWKGKSQAGEALGAVGCWKVLAQVIRMLKESDLENLWPLLVPPLLTMLDDHENRYRREGIRCLSLFLEKCPGQLLHRTGLGDLVQKSLYTTYSFTSASENIPMMRTALSSHLQLLDLLYPVSRLAYRPPYTVQKITPRATKAKDPPALLRFNALCELHQSIVINIFAYSSTSIPFMTFSFSVIPILVEKLGAAYIRFLSDTLPVLCTGIGGTKAQRQIGSSILTKETVEMRTEATRALSAIVEVCEGTGRMDKWRGMILSSIATFWVFWRELDLQRREYLAGEDAEKALRQLLEATIKDSGDAAMKDIQRVSALDRTLFQPLCAT